MMEGMPILSIIGTVLYWIVQLLVLAGCLLLAYNYRKSSAYIMLLGAFLSLFFSLTGTFINYAFAQESSEALLTSYGMVSILSGVSHGIFAIGLIWFALSKKKETPSP